MECRARLPCAAVGLLWAVAHHGFGTHGSGWYFDPLTEPARYWGAFLERAPMLLLNVFTLLDSELYPFLPRAWAHLALAVAVLLLGGLVALLARQVRQSPLARFWALAALLSLLPVCANSPAGRLTLFVAFATLGLLAQLLGAAVERGDGLGAPFPRGARGLVAIAVGLHLVLAPLTVPVVSGLQVMGTLLGGLAASLPRDPALAQQSLVLVGGPDPFAGYLWSLPAMSGQPAPARIWTLGVGLAPLALYRPDARTLVVRPEGGFLRDRFAPLVFRDPRDLLPLGQQVHLAGLTVEVTALTNDGRPAEATFRFAVPLEDPALRWMRWSGGLELSPFTPPAVGETRALGEVTLQRRVGVSSR